MPSSAHSRLEMTVVSPPEETVMFWALISVPCWVAALRLGSTASSAAALSGGFQKRMPERATATARTRGAGMSMGWP
jgi:hypothetical protein